ncbi:MAG: anti-sigma factor [Paracoccaceae bacterium]
MTDTPFTPREEDEALAAEYVLGLPDLAERLGIEARIKADPDFAALVQAWEARLSGLNDAFDPVPAPNLLPQIEARLFPTPARPARRGLFWLLAPLAAALVLAAIFFLTPREAMLVASVSSEDASLVYEARSLGDQLTFTRVAGTAAAPGKVHEMWIIAPGADPVSLGLLEDTALTVTYPIPPKGWTLAVTLEPAGGGPGGKPTGPVIAAAEIGA